MIYRISGYLVFFVISTLFWLYWLFPAQPAADYIQRAVSRHPDGPVLGIEGLTPALPRGLAADTVHIQIGQGMPGILIQDPVCRLEVKTLFKEVRQVTFHGNLSGGRVSGSAFIGKTGLAGLRLSTRLEDIQVQNVDLTVDQTQFAVSGRLTGRIDTGLVQGKVAGVQGEVNLTDPVLVFAQPLFGVDRYPFASAGLSFERPEPGAGIRIERFTLTGRQLNMTARGDLFPGVGPEDTGLDLTVQLTLYPLFFMNAGDASPVDVARGGTDEVVLNLTLTGTLAAPRVRMQGGNE